MATAHTFKELVKELQQKTGLTDLLSKDEQRFSLLFEDDIIVDIGYRSSKDTLLFFASLIPIDNDPDIYAGLLKANYLFKGTDGPTLALEPDTNNLVLNYECGLEGLTVENLMQIIEHFYSTCQNWIKKLQAKESKTIVRPIFNSSYFDVIA
ncbi:MAG: type III secretion system chaperone [Desulfobacteraceae bacterium]|nr:type III secretion system chaperone [Desulfobacteraceae bacterium]